LLDAFFEAAPTARKKRVHFHTLFRELHAAVHAHRSATHAFDAAVEELLTECTVVCFDEFHFHDIGDAMLVSRLLRRLFERGTTLVATSNYPPEGLLPNPLYHDQFQPTIDLIRQHLTVLQITGPTDYRADIRPENGSGGFRAGALIWPGTDEQLASLGLSQPAAGDARALKVGSRTVQALRAEESLVWFDFAQLCESHTSSSDLLVLADRFRAWVVSAVPGLASRSADAQQRFVNLIDIIHDRDIKLTLICDVPPGVLLADQLLVPDSDRTASRLQLIAERPSTSGTKT
jgi:cell division protein ZapE